MAEPQFPDDGGLGYWLYLWLTIAGAAGGFLQYVASAATNLLWWRKKAIAKREAESKRRQDELTAEVVDRAYKKVTDRIDDEMSEIRQHMAAVQKGVEGKQRVMDARLGGLYKEMRDRDERLTEGLHRRLSTEIRDLRSHIDKQLDNLRDHFSDVLDVALNGRKPRG